MTGYALRKQQILAFHVRHGHPGCGGQLYVSYENFVCPGARCFALILLPYKIAIRRPRKCNERPTRQTVRSQPSNHAGQLNPEWRKRLLQLPKSFCLASSREISVVAYCAFENGVTIPPGVHE